MVECQGWLFIRFTLLFTATGDVADVLVVFLLLLRVSDIYIVVFVVTVYFNNLPIIVPCLLSTDVLTSTIPTLDPTCTRLLNTATAIHPT